MDKDFLLHNLPAWCGPFAEGTQHGRAYIKYVFSTHIKQNEIPNFCMFLCRQLCDFSYDCDCTINLFQ